MSKTKQEYQYALPDTITGEEVRQIRQTLGLTQRAFAEYIRVSKPTVERWECGETDISGPIIPLLSILREQPQFEEAMRITPKTTPLRLYYLMDRMMCTVIDVDEPHRRVWIRNYTDNPVCRAFGRQEHPSFSEYEEFLESRCFPRQRDKIKLHLQELGIPFYEPLLIIEKTQGRMAGDHFWIKIER